MGKQFWRRRVARSWTTARHLLGLLGLLLVLLRCSAGEPSGSLPPPAARDLQLEQEAVENLLALYQTAQRQEDIDRLQALLPPGTALRQTPSRRRHARRSAAETTRNAAEFVEGRTTVFRTQDLIDLHILAPAIRLEAERSSVAFLQVENSVVGSGATLEQQTLAIPTTLRLRRSEAAGKVTFAIDSVQQEAPQFQVGTPGRVLAGAPARVIVRELTGRFPITAVTVEVSETETGQDLVAADGIFHGLFTPPLRLQAPPLRVRIRGTQNHEVVFPHHYRLRLQDDSVVQRLAGTEAARFAALALAPDGTVWAGGTEAPERGGVLYNVLPNATAASFVGSLLKNPHGEVEDLVFDQRGRLHAVVFSQGTAASPPESAVIVLDQNVFCRTVNAFDPGQSYPFQVRDRTSGTLVPSPSTRAVAATAGRILLHGSDGGAALVTDTFQHGECPADGIEVRYDPVFRRTPEELPTNSVLALVVGSDGALWFGTALGLTRLHEGQFTPVPFDSQLSIQGDAQTLEEFFQDVAEAIFNATPITAVRIGGVSFIDEFGAPLRKEDLISSAVEDQRQRLWVGTFGAGIRRIEVKGGVPQDTLHLTRQDGLSSNVIFALAVGPDGSIWAATVEGVSWIQEVDGALLITNFTALDGLAVPVRDVLVDKRHVVWLATAAGLFRIVPHMGLIRGVVRDTTGRAVQGADVSVTDTPFRAVTDAEGRFVLAYLPLGTYLLQFDGSLAASGPTTIGFQEVTIRAGEQTLPAAVELPPQVTDAFRLSVRRGDGASGVVVQVLDTPLVVEVRDGTGTLIPQIPVTFTVLAGTGTVRHAAVRTNRAGQAVTLLTLGTRSGDNIVEARTPGLPPVVITVTGQADRGHAQLIEVRGNNQAGAPGALLPEPLVVRLVDQFGNPLAGETVTATVRAGTATFASNALPTADFRTNDQGEAAFSVQLGDTVAGGILVEMTALTAASVQFVAAAVGALVSFGNGIAVAVDETLLVLDTGRHQLLRFDPGNGRRTVVSSETVGTGPMFGTPQELVRTGPTSVVVGNGFPAALLQVDLKSGERAVVSGSVGMGPTLGFPVALAREASGSIIVGDGFVAETSLPALIRVDTETGERSLVSGCAAFDVNAARCTIEVGAGPALGWPEALTIAASGAILVGDTATRAILRVNQDNGNREVVSGCADALCSAIIGTGPPLGIPQALAVDAEGRLIVAEAGVPETAFTTTRALLQVDLESGNRMVLSGCADATCSTLRGIGPAFSAPFPDAIAIRADGALVVFDRGLAGGAIMQVNAVHGTRRILFLLQE